MSTLNLGILAHVDAGKTSLTERLLHAAGVIDTLGSVDEGSTQTDSLELERRRGIPIKAAVVSFQIDGFTVNLIDTPGHPDFIAEVDRVLSVLDGAVLVVSAVEGVQAQTRVLMRALQRLRIPTLIFVNKIDRSGAQYEHVLRSIAERLTPTAVAMGSTRASGTRGAAFELFGADDAEFTSRLTEVLAERDDALLAAFVQDEASISHETLRAELAAQTKRALVHPVFFGSAIIGAGVGELTEGIRTLLPAADGDADAPVSGTVFKVERGPAGEKIAYARIFSGTVRTRDKLRFGQQAHSSGHDDRDGRWRESKITAISVFDQGSAAPADSVGAGRIGKLWGLADVRIGDDLGAPRAGNDERRQFAPPTLETVVAPRRAADKGALHVALTRLAEQDPLINLRRDELRQEISVSLYGEVQKEVIQTTLAEEFGLDVEFRQTTTLHIERPLGVGADYEIIDKNGNPFLATVGLRVEPAPIGSGVHFRLEVELGSMPYAFFKAVEDTVHETLRQGIYGWQVTDCVVTMTHSGYWPRQSHAHAVFDKSMSSTAGDFRSLTPLVLMSALRQAGSAVYEPVHRFRLDLPTDSLAAVMPVLARVQAVADRSITQGPLCVLEGEIPAARVHELEQTLPALTRGEGVLECAFGHYRPVRGPAPSRPRADHNPLDRKEYLLHVQRRV